MCGRSEAGQKQKIAEAFHVSVTLNDIYFGADKECVPRLDTTGRLDAKWCAPDLTYSIY